MLRVLPSTPYEEGGGVMSDTAQELDWWQESDGKWYAPQPPVPASELSLALLPQPPAPPALFVPSAPIMAKKTYASPLSFVGATRGSPLGAES